MNAGQESSSFSVGVSKIEITPDCAGVGMLGWGDPMHRVRGVKRPLYARAISITAASGGRLIHVCVELCFVTEALREAVLERLSRDHAALKIRPEELLLAATHTHNAPGGHSKYLLYNLTVPGFQPKVFDVYRDGIVDAIVKACARQVAATLRLCEGAFATDSKVAFNRSLEAWHRNPEARPGEEIDRRMTVLRIDRAGGTGAPAAPLAMVSWFPVHCTSVHRDYHYIHSDNKGVAAQAFEDEAARQGWDGFVAVFAQGAAGDVTPNFMTHKGCRDMRGPFADDEKSCEFNAQLQYGLAREIFEQAAATPVISGPIAGLVEHHDFSKVEVAPELCGGRRGVRTGPAMIGCNFMRGTAEGRGAPEALVIFSKIIARAHQYLRYLGILLRGKRIPPPWSYDPVQGPKIAFMETGRGRVLGASRATELVIPGWLHPAVANLKRMARERRGRERFAFTPQNLPVQVVTIGSLALVAVPAEFTTVSGRRLGATVQGLLGELGIARTLVCGYANAYSGYVTTYEEYQVQAYEGSSTHFGMWTLAAYQTVFIGLCRRVILRARYYQLLVPETAPCPVDPRDDSGRI